MRCRQRLYSQEVSISIVERAIGLEPLLRAVDLLVNASSGCFIFVDGIREGILAEYSCWDLGRKHGMFRALRRR